MLCKHKDLSLIPKTLKMPGVVGHARNPSIGEAETEALRAL